MSGLLDEILDAHGGLQRWQAVTPLSARGTFDGLLRARFPGNRMSDPHITGAMSATCSESTSSSCRPANSTNWPAEREMARHNGDRTYQRHVSLGVAERRVTSRNSAERVH